MFQPYNQDGVRQERTGWRDQSISERHRRWGFNCPAVDLDFLMAEYNHGEPSALIEYKHEGAAPPNVNHPTYRALSNLATHYDKGPLPFVIVFYHSEHWWFEVCPINQSAHDFYKRIEVEQGLRFVGKKITEQWFVYSLYRMRKETLDQRDCEAIMKLNSVLPS
jgi:hypothetical protein